MGEQGSLAGPVGAKQPKHFTRLDVETNSIQSHGAAVAFAHVADFKKRPAHPRLASASW